jgi:DNA uptake protein ComE-like DNA-binding protein
MRSIPARTKLHGRTAGTPLRPPAARLRPASGLRLGTGLLLSAGLFAALTAGCRQTPTDQQIREKSAEAAREARQNAQDLAANARTAAATAVNGANAVAEGVREGVAGGPGEPVDINHASVARLAMLPGVSLEQARRIADGRPYASPHQLVTRKRMTEREYERASGPAWWRARLGVCGSREGLRPAKVAFG